MVKKFYYLAPQKINVGDKIKNGSNIEIKVGNCMPLQEIPVGMEIHNVEINLVQEEKLLDQLVHLYNCRCRWKLFAN